MTKQATSPDPFAAGPEARRCTRRDLPASTPGTNREVAVLSLPMNTKPTPKKYVALAPRADHRTPPERSATEGGVRQIRTAPRRAHPADRQRSALLRSELGGVLRQTRHRQCMTLRDVSESARVSLGYLSEVERGHKEASSELLASICEALDVPLWLTLYEVADRLAAAEGESVEGYHAARRLSLVR